MSRGSSSSSVTDLSSLLSLSRDILNVYQGKGDTPRFIAELNKQVSLVETLLRQLQAMQSDGAPPDKQLVALRTDIESDLKSISERVRDWASKNDRKDSWLRFVPVVKPFVQSLAPAFALYVAMLPATTITMIVLLVICLGAVLFTHNPDVVRDFGEAWDNREKVDARAALLLLALLRHSSRSLCACL